ncbi:hypothetical protein Hanom_Chr15g01359281 [Helianthus anomalus]
MQQESKHECIDLVLTDYVSYLLVVLVLPRLFRFEQRTIAYLLS